MQCSKKNVQQQIRGATHMGIVIPFHSLGSSLGSTKLKSFRNSGLNKLSSPSPGGSESTKRYFAGMEPIETHWFNDVRLTPSNAATSERLPLALSTVATVIDITPYIRNPGTLSSGGNHSCSFSPQIRNNVICKSHIHPYNYWMATT
jgi:hypothetical protein